MRRKNTIPSFFYKIFLLNPVEEICFLGCLHETLLLAGAGEVALLDMDRIGWGTHIGANIQNLTCKYYTFSQKHVFLLGTNSGFMLLKFDFTCPTWCVAYVTLYTIGSEVRHTNDVTIVHKAGALSTWPLLYL